MESQPQNPEFRINPEYFHPCIYQLGKTFCNVVFKSKFKNWPLLFNETLIELLHTEYLIYYA